MYLAKCLFCNKEFKNKYKRKFCSRICANRNTSKIRAGNEPIDMKKCSTCGRLLSLKSFYPAKNRRKNRRSNCKFCVYLSNASRRFKITKDEILYLLKKENFRCGICGISIKEIYDNPENISRSNGISIDHKNPNGLNKLGNYHITHLSCNLYKQKRTMQELFDWCKKVIDYRNQALTIEDITESAK